MRCASCTGTCTSTHIAGVVAVVELTLGVASVSAAEVRIIVGTITRAWTYTCACAGTEPALIVGGVGIAVQLVMSMRRAGVVVECARAGIL